MTNPVSTNPVSTLRALAEAATPGPWMRSDIPGDTMTVWQSPSGGAVCWVNEENATGYHHPDADAAYIAAASPAVILALLDVVDAARAHLRADGEATYSWVAQHAEAVEQTERRADARHALRVALARAAAVMGEGK